MSVFSWSLSFLRPYRTRVIAIALLALVEIGLGALAPWPMKAIVDNVFGGHPFPQPLATIAETLTRGSVPGLLVLVAMAGLGLQLLLELVRGAHTQFAVDTGQRIVYDLRARLLSHLQALPLRYHVLGRTADSVYRLESDAYCVNDLVIGGVFPLTTAALNLTVMFGILMGLDPILGLLSLAVAPFLYVSLRYYSRTMTDRAERVKQQEATLVERAYEILSSIAAIKSFARERHELNRFTRVGEETMQARNSAGFAAYSGIAEVRELDYASLANPRFPVNSVAVLARVDADDVRTANVLNVGVGRLRLSENYAGNRLWSLAAAELYFRRPADDSGLIEYASLYNPYWQVRLVEPSAGQRAAALAYVR